jgi:hypothetical protein
MDSLKRYLVIAAGVLLCSLALSSTTVVQAVVDKATNVFVTNDSAHAVPVTGTVTAVGRAPSELITLIHLSPSSSGYVRQFPNGAFDSGDFAIPAGKVFVVTDINVTFRRGAGEAGKTAAYFLQSSDATAGTATRARLQTTLNGEAEGGAAEHYQTGIVFASSAAFTDSLDGSSTFDVAEVRGYLADDN